MIKYKLIAATDVTSFDQLMTDALNNGWKMHGKLIVTPHHDASGHGMQYTQAIVRKAQKQSTVEINVSTPSSPQRVGLS